MGFTKPHFLLYFNIMIFNDKQDAFSYIKNLTKGTDLKIIVIRRKQGIWGLTIGKNDNDCCDYYIRPKNFKTVMKYNAHNNDINEVKMPANCAWISFNWFDMEVTNKLCREELKKYANKHRIENKEAMP